MSSPVRPLDLAARIISSLGSLGKAAGEDATVEGAGGVEFWAKDGMETGMNAARQIIDVEAQRARTKASFSHGEKIAQGRR